MTLVSDSPPKFDIGDKVVYLPSRGAAVVTDRSFELMNDEFVYTLRFVNGRDGKASERNLKKL